jgi:transposase InsO family protein/predicted aspartyl protease
VDTVRLICRTSTEPTPSPIESGTTQYLNPTVDTAEVVSVKQMTIASSSKMANEHCDNGQLTCCSTSQPEPQESKSTCEVKVDEPKGWTMVLPVTIAGYHVQAIVDTGSQITVISQSLFDRLNLIGCDSSSLTLRGITDENLTAKVVKDVQLGIGKQTFSWDLIVANIRDDFILGLDFLKEQRALIDINTNVLILNKEVVPVSCKRNSSGEEVITSRVTLNSTIVIPADSGFGVECDINPPIAETFMIEPYLDHPFLVVPRILANGSSKICMRILNPTCQSIKLDKGRLLGIAMICEPLEEGDLEPTETIKGFPTFDQLNSSPFVRTCVSQDMDGLPCPTSRKSSVSVESISVSQSVDDLPHHIAEQASVPQGVDDLPHPKTGNIVPQHLEILYQDAAKRLSPEQCEVLRNLLCEYQDVFARDSQDLGHFTTIKHHIQTMGPPVKLRMRRTPLGFQEEEEGHLQSMLNQGVIQPSCSEWAAAPVLVRKKDGSVRYCIDYRALNDRTIKDAFPLPLIEECLDTLQGVHYFSTLDMMSGYWQVEIAEEDRHKTAFLTKYGLFEHVRMAFGLCNAPATHQRAMNFLLQGILWKTALAYLDDTIILGCSFDDHINNLEEVLRRFRLHNLKLKPKKCKLFHQEVEFLGRKVGRDGITIQDSKIQAVLDWPTPRDKTQLEQFLGFANYHRAFVPDFAGKTSCLYALTGKREFNWGPPQQSAFESLKTLLVTAPLLAYPSTEEGDTFILDTDASQVAIGAELSQIQSGVERTIAYGSQALTATQKNYCVTRKELLSVVVFTRQFRHYLLGRSFLLRTDHHSLVWLMRFKEPQSQLSRWQEELNQYDMKIIHRPGNKHVNADSLSRIPSNIDPCSCYHAGSNLSDLPCGGCPYCTRCHQQWRKFEDDIDDVVPLAVRVIDADSTNQEAHEEDSTWIQIIPAKDLREQQLADPDLKPLITWLESGTDPPDDKLWLCSPATKHFWSCKTQLTFKDGVLYYIWVDGPFHRLKLLVPRALKDEVLRLGHDVRTASHSGQQKTLLRLKRHFIWYRMGLDVKLYVSTCSVCNQNKKPQRKPRAAMKSYHAGVPMERVHLDLVGPLKLSKKGNRYILVMVDQFTKWFECHPLPEQNAELVARCALHEFFCRMGCPLQAHTDQGAQFTGSVFMHLCELLEVTKTRTTPYRPSANGQVERYNRDLLKAIRCFLNGKQDRWDEYLPLIAMAIRCTENRTTGFTANMMMLGREISTPLELVTGVSRSNNSPKAPAEHVKQLSDRLKEVHTLARENIGLTQRHQKRTYDLKLRQHVFQIGDLVYRLDSASSPGESRKLKPVYIGPLIVSEVLSPLLYRVEGRRRTQILHHDRLRVCEDRVIPMWVRRKRHEILNLDTTLPYGHDELDDLPVNATNVPSTTVDSDLPEHTSSIDTTLSSPTGDTEEFSEEDLDTTILYNAPELDSSIDQLTVDSEEILQDRTEEARFSTRGRPIRRPKRLATDYVM